MIRKNFFSIITALIIMFLSLASAETFKKIPVYHFRGIDKVVHFCMYLIFTGVILFENRKTISRTGHLFLIALIPLFFGGLMELLQSWLTTTRTGSIFDLLFNILGILFSLLIFRFISHPGKESVR